MKRVRYFAENEVRELNEKEVTRLKTLWADQVFQDMAMKTRSETVLHLPYFIDRLDAIATADYIPTDDDILHCRQRTTGGSTTSFVVCYMSYFLLVTSL